MKPATPWLLVTMMVTHLLAANMPVSYGYGTIVNSCGPTDAAMWMLDLTAKPIACNHQPTEPYISLMLDPIANFPRTITFPGKNKTYDAQLCDRGPCEPVASGKIVFDHANKGGIAGYYEFVFKGGTSVAGMFEVRRCFQRILCG